MFHKEQIRVDEEYAEQCRGEVKLVELWTSILYCGLVSSTVDLFSTVDLPSLAVDLFPILLH